MKTIKDFDIKDKKVLIRCDFNVPIINGKIGSEFRIKQALPTLEYAQKQGAKLILMSHLGDNKEDLSPVWSIVKKYIGDKNIVFLENLRINKGEEANDDEFAKQLASLGDIYINDAFGVCHRNHASVSAITKFLPSGAGLLLEKEIKILSQILENPARPLIAIIGGAKVSSKTKVINKFLKIADHLLFGGKIANAILAAKGITLNGLTEDDKKEIENINITSTKIHLPIDAVVSRKSMALGKVKKDDVILDIGQETITMFSEIIREAKTIIWSGPLGLFEQKPFEKGTKEIAKSICKNNQAFKVAGGGDTTNAIEKFKLEEKFDHLSTGGGAMLAFLGGEELPGLKALGYYGEN